MNNYPIYLNLEHQPCLVVGGGQVAERKVASLLECGAKVTLISPKVTDQILKWAQTENITYLCRGYEKGDVEGYFLVIGATDVETVNQLIATDCFERKILINVVDDPPKCNFIVPAVVKQGDLSISISTGGKSPVLARKIREKLEQDFGAEYAEFLELMGELRPTVIRQVPDISQRKKIFTALVESDILELLRQGRKAEVKERINRVLDYSGN